MFQPHPDDKEGAGKHREREWPVMQRNSLRMAWGWNSGACLRNRGGSPGCAECRISGGMSLPQGLALACLGFGLYSKGNGSHQRF